MTNLKLLFGLLVCLPLLFGFPWVNLGGGVEAGGGAPPGPGLTLLHAMDANGTNCTDSNPSYTCTLSGCGAACAATGPCPLEGTESIRCDATTEEALYAGLTPVTTGFLTLDFMFDLESSHTVWRDVFGMTADSSTNPDYQCYMEFKGDTNEVRSRSHNGTGSTAISISQNTTYYGRLIYDVPNDDCTLHVSATNFGNTDVGSQTDNGTNPGSVVGWAIETQLLVATIETVYDDIALCSGDAGTTAGRCDT